MQTKEQIKEVKSVAAIHLDQFMKSIWWDNISEYRNDITILNLLLVFKNDLWQLRVYI